MKISESITTSPFQTKRDSDIGTYSRVSNFTEHSISVPKEINKKSLKSLVDYVSNLRKKGAINDKQFSNLVYVICTNFIENEIEIRLGEKTQKYLNEIVHKLL